MRGCEDARMRGCEDARMRGCEDARMCGCVDVWMCGCVDVWMRGCVDAWTYGSAATTPCKNALEIKGLHPMRRAQEADVGLLVRKHTDRYHPRPLAHQGLKGQGILDLQTPHIQ